MLVDKFGRVHKYLRISLTDRCNLACNYCMPPGGAESKTHQMTAPEIERIARVFVDRCGINKIRLTGGEPTLRSDFSEIAQRLGALKVDQLAITTNGLLLNRYADVLVNNRFLQWNISVDTLDREKFPLISNKTQQIFDRISSNIDAAIALLEQQKLRSVKLNTVVMKHVNDDEILALAALTKTWPIQLRFIELMPFSGNNYSSKLFMSKAEILDTLNEGVKLERVDVVASEGSASTGRDIWRIPSFRGEIGVISSMTDAFCGSCDRLRLTADGNVRNCLFSAARAEESLVTILRRGGSDDELEHIIRINLDKKFFSHGGKNNPVDIARSVADSRPMVSIGG